MEIKKNKKSNLEKFKLNFLSIGLIITLVLILSAFNWQTKLIISEDYTIEELIEEEIIEITRNDIEKPTPLEINQKIIIPEIIEIVENHIEIDTNTVVWTEEIEIDEIKEEINEIFYHVQQMPKFPGGTSALLAFIYNNVNYPSIARENDIQGTVHMKFEVTKTGKIGQIIVQNPNVDKLLKDASINVIKKLPKFKPGFQNGKYVSVWFTLPITFKLN